MYILQCGLLPSFLPTYLSAFPLVWLHLCIFYVCICICVYISQIEQNLVLIHFFFQFNLTSFKIKPSFNLIQFNLIDSIFKGNYKWLMRIKKASQVPFKTEKMCGMFLTLLVLTGTILWIETSSPGNKCVVLFDVL